VWDQEHITELKTNGIIKEGFLQELKSSNRKEAYEWIFFLILTFCRDVIEEVLCIIRHSQYACLFIYYIVYIYNMLHQQGP
jgi:hypothetical protein